MWVGNCVCIASVQPLVNRRCGGICALERHQFDVHSIFHSNGRTSTVEPKQTEENNLEERRRKLEWAQPSLFRAHAHFDGFISMYSGEHVSLICTCVCVSICLHTLHNTTLFPSRTAVDNGIKCTQSAQYNIQLAWNRTASYHCNDFNSNTFYSFKIPFSIEWNYTHTTHTILISFVCLSYCCLFSFSLTIFSHHRSLFRLFCGVFCSASPSIPLTQSTSKANTSKTKSDKT